MGELAKLGDVRAVEIFVEPRDLAVLDLADDRAGQAYGAVVVGAAALQHMLLDETAEGNVFAALRMREADLEKHLNNGPEDNDARQKARDEARAKLEAEYAKRAEPPKPLPEFGSTEDFPLVQALNQLKGQPVIASKT
eukprot:gene2000-2491_t